MKYLIIECREVNDLYVYDVRTPLCITDDPAPYEKYGYEIYEVQEDGSFKQYEFAITAEKETGLALYYWPADADTEEDEPVIVDIFPGFNRSHVTAAMVALMGFEEEPETIIDLIRSSGGYSEIVDNEYTVISEYRGDYFPPV
jgi:hypothetical protein